MSVEREETAANGAVDEEDFEELTVESTEDGTVLLQGTDWGIELSPEGARELAQALLDAASDAEEPEE